jgi:hypothetical protein
MWRAAPVVAITASVAVKKQRQNGSSHFLTHPGWLAPARQPLLQRSKSAHASRSLNNARQHKPPKINAADAPPCRMPVFFTSDRPPRDSMDIKQ